MTENSFSIQVLSLVFSLLSVSGCAIYKDPISVTYVDAGTHHGPEIIAEGDVRVNTPSSSPMPSKPLNSKSSAPSTEPPTPVIPKSAYKTEVIEACARIAPPILGQIPRLTPKQIESVATATPSNANTQLLDELEKIYKYSNGKTAELRAAFNKHWQSCRRVTIIVP